LATGDAGGGYRIAVAAFRTSKRAIDVASDIAAKGLPVSTRADASGEWYQVVVGPFASQEAAANAQRTLAREGFADTRITPSVSER
jgi:cell division protein FtsN